MTAKTRQQRIVLGLRLAGCGSGQAGHLHQQQDEVGVYRFAVGS